MVDSGQAREIAQKWIDSNFDCSGDDDEIVVFHVREEEFGWIFFYQSKRYLETCDFSDQLLGNAPVIVKRESGEVVVTGTAKPIDDYVRDLQIQGVV